MTKFFLQQASHSSFSTSYVVIFFTIWEPRQYRAVRYMGEYEWHNFKKDYKSNTAAKTFLIHCLVTLIENHLAQTTYFKWSKIRLEFAQMLRRSGFLDIFFFGRQSVSHWRDSGNRPGFIPENDEAYRNLKLPVAWQALKTCPIIWIPIRPLCCQA
jgi:hypothetical protein